LQYRLAGKSAIAEGQAARLSLTRIAQWRQRLPRTLYSKLTKQAENEGVSINSLVTAIIAEAIGAKQARS
jgi:predicted HicB family RNase H-like nuclease